MEELTADSARA